MSQLKSSFTPAFCFSPFTRWLKHLTLSAPFCSPSFRGLARLLIEWLAAAFINQALILCRLQPQIVLLKKKKKKHGISLHCNFLQSKYGPVCIRSVPFRLTWLAGPWAQLGLCLAIQSVTSMHKSAQGMIWTESLQQIITDLQFNGFWGLSQPHTGSQRDRAY